MLSAGDLPALRFSPDGQNGIVTLPAFIRLYLRREKVFVVGDSVENTLLVITVDTEEDQWGPCEGRVSVDNISCLPRLQSLFDQYGVVPTYLVTYPVAAGAQSSRILSKVLDSGRCEIGSHLHPWNTPPLREEMTNRNTMLGNLPYELQSEKIAFLTEFLSGRFGCRPRSFRAGRWGLGPETVKALVAHGYLVDTSVTPFISWEAYEGPSFVSAPLEPHTMGVNGTVSIESINSTIFEVPASIGYSRWPFGRQRRAEEVLDTLPSRSHLKGMAARLNILRKIWMEPEMEKTGNMLLLSRILIDRGVRVLNLFFHTNSLLPGLTPFTRTGDDVERLYEKLSIYLENIMSSGNIVPVGLSQVKELLCERKNLTGFALSDIGDLRSETAKTEVQRSEVRKFESLIKAL